MATCVSCDTCNPACPVRGGSPSTRPLIFVSPRFEPGRMYGDEQLSPNEATTKCYVDAIFEAGGLPVMMNIPEDDTLIEEYVRRADGICLPGGPDVSPRLWGDASEHPGCTFCPERDAFELPLIRACVAADKPLFTICRGTQMLNVAFGGTLCMDVPGLPRKPGSTPHVHANLIKTATHDVLIEEGTILQRACGGEERYAVNSAHHCCVERLGRGLISNARSDDGVPEGIEMPNKRFVLGVQWHPEYTWYSCDADFALWKAFVDACR
ncbi:gamma-glutamyl-gamma-aminobutyrate hydrolase family protein [Paratractidigestivibacter sp.]|uniref:gamma-glutamyl-gamma-aminobutyrate hydrolase family protein n=1 Tax=Paratractidigestivibacter sp. TaxID=2847316 RepID=UPI002ABE4373|nr:gamma-glutamyl-gamma-aminobutyrate hydrolase family protein [Paratractidigestivibacter sp.]